jgi:two-component system sensor histidine kinase CiaH
MNKAHLLKRFEALGIALRHNLFLQARLKLTALYVVIVAIIVFGFSIFLFSSLERNLRDASEDDFANANSRAHFIEHTVRPIRNTLLFTDVLIILSAAGVSYWLAGKTLKPVQNALEAQRLFATQASHELRTPLAVMRNDSEVTLRNPRATTSDLRETLSSTIEEIEKMSQLVEDLLVLARSENAQVAAHGNVNIADIQRETLLKLEPLTKQKGLVIISETHGKMDIIGNEQELKRVLINILQNSIEHTDEGGEIRLISQEKKGFVQLNIQDTGCGIATHDLPHVFNRFYKGNRSSEKEGTGLGLSIVKEIVTQHEGSIEIDSTEGLGTTVRITFPLA